MGFPKNIIFRQARYVGARGQIASGGNGVANRILLYEFLVYAQQTFTILRWQTGSLPAGNYDIGIYNSNLQALYRKGSTPMPGASTQTSEAINLSLPPGKYYYAFVIDNVGGNKLATVETIVNTTKNVKWLDGVFPLPLDASAATLIPNGTNSVQFAYVPWFNVY